MSDSDGPPGVSATEHRRILRWIAAVALLTTAEDQLGVDVPELNAVGLLAAEAACEAMLGLVVGSLQAKVVGGREPGFLEVLGEAITAANGGISRELRNDLQGMHRTRNAFVHGGSAVDLAELERAVQAAHRLTGVVPVAGRRPVTGVASSLADVIVVDDEAVSLSEAELEVARLHVRAQSSPCSRHRQDPIDNW